MEYEQFDRRLARECAKAFSQSTGLGCTLSDKTGRAFDEYGYGCESCGMCAAAGASHDRCVQAHIYGMTEAERFGGKYIYFCPMGLTCFVSPILGEGGAEAKITVGPFIMVEKQDFIACELTENVRLTEAQKQAAVQVLENIPFVPTERVTQLSVLLFMADGFMNNVSAENRMMESGHSEELQGQITSYILELKQEEAPPPYPFEKEHVLLQCVARKDRDGARRLLNELLGAILFVDGGDMELVKSRLYELLVLISRTAIENGADAEHTMRLSHEYRYRIGAFTTIDSLCLWLAGVVNHFMDDLFRFSDAKHANIIHRCTQYISANYKERITLEDTARMVYLSPAYLSRIFKQETGVTFNEYLNRVRVNKAKELLAYELTSLVHSKEDAEKAIATAKRLFSGEMDAEHMPATVVDATLVADGKASVLDLLVAAGLAPSKGEARRLVQQGGISVDGEKVTDVSAVVNAEALGKGIVIKKGKKVYHRITL